MLEGHFRRKFFFLDSHVVYFHFLLLSYALSLVWACGDIWSLMCQVVFSGLTTFLLPFQCGHCTFLTLHLQQLLDSLCMPTRQACLFCSPEGLHFCFPSACESVLGLANQWTSWSPVDCNHTFLYMVWCPFERRKPPLHICLSLGLLLEPL